MKQYLPEEMQPQRELTPDDLRKAAQTGEILTGTAFLCDEHCNLHVAFGGGVTGVIPYPETALGIADGSVREIAVISRVGKPVCCKVLAWNGAARLSRAAAQREAQDHFFSALGPGDILPAVVINPAAFGAFCDIGCGVVALLGIESISVSRISHSADRFAPGQRIHVVLKQLDRETRRISLSHRELLGTWEENAERFRPGQTVTGIVRSVKEYGVFIELTPNLSGLAEEDGTLRPGDAVSVYIKSIQPERQKIKLSVVGRLDSASLPRLPMRYTQTAGRMDYWQYSANSQKIYTLF